MLRLLVVSCPVNGSHDTPTSPHSHLPVIETVSPPPQSTLRMLWGGGGGGRTLVLLETTTLHTCVMLVALKLLTTFPIRFRAALDGFQQRYSRIILNSCQVFSLMTEQHL
jgi:hypothetical protein